MCYKCRIVGKMFIDKRTNGILGNRMADKTKREWDSIISQDVYIWYCEDIIQIRK